jgi:hypothetical protein
MPMNGRWLFGDWRSDCARVPQAQRVLSNL